MFEASIPSIVKKELLIDANSLVEVTNSILTILGPAFAGVLIAYFSASSTILFTAFSCLAAGIIALFIKISKEYIEKR
ncbi:MFS transporter [Bacillus cereus]|uniref:MFS transporter n=1 Tax=Bacillus cereus TaxID=1396 RepID=UPI0011220BF5